MRRLGNSGFSTLEVLIAMTILVVSVTAVTVTSFGSQSLALDAETGSEALDQAEDGLEYMETLARQDFHLVTPTSSLAAIGGVSYLRTIEVSTTTLPDYATKRVKSAVTWTGEHGRTERVSLSALVTNFDRVSGGDTCDSVATGNWTSPAIANAITNLSSLSSTSTGANVITALDAYKGRLYVTVSAAQYRTDPRLFVFDIAKLKSDPANSLVGKLATASNTATYGMYALAVAEGPAGKRYAYVANDYPANWGSCSAYYNCAQLLVVDATDPAKWTLASSTYLKLPNVTGGLNSGGAGTSIAYKDGLVYLGLSKTSTGPEFVIVDVHDPRTPTLVPGSSLDLGYDVNAIVLSGTTAYLAMGNDSGEVVLVDVSNPSAPTVRSTYNAPGQLSAGYGRSLEMVGTNLYLGRSYVSNAAEFLVLDASSSTGVIPATPLGSRDLGVIATPYTVYGALVRGALAFIAGGSSSGGKLYIENLENLANVVDHAPPLDLPSGSFGFAIDCEGNDVFVASRDNTASNYGYLSVIAPSP